jgi:hypothetical protein
MPFVWPGVTSTWACHALNEEREGLRRPKRTGADAFATQIWFAFASRQTLRSLCVRPLEMVFCPRSPKSIFQHGTIVGSCLDFCAMGNG